MTKEHRDYLLIKELYHCSPKELDDVDDSLLDLHFSFLMAEREHEFIESKRNEQRAKVKNSFPKKR